MPCYNGFMSFFGNPNPESFKKSSGYTIDGVWYPRVTSIVSIKAKPALYRFYAELNGFAEGEAIKKLSADEGTLVHETVEKIMTGQKVEIPQTIKPSVTALMKFLEEKNIQIDSDYVEHRIVNYNDRYAGTCDALALIDGRYGVLDIKTSQSIYRDYSLQTSAYMSPLQEQLRNLSTRWILRIDQNQKCQICGGIRRTKGGREKIRGVPRSKVGCPHEWSEMRGEIELKEFPYWEQDFQAFLGAKRLWEWENDGVLRKIGYLS